MTTRRTAVRLGLGWLLTFGLPAWCAAAFPPQLNRQGREAYAEYQGADVHRAFAIAPGGAWAWRAEMSTRAAAEAAALADCRRLIGQRCLLYAVDQDLVFDARAWREAWRPYATADQVRRAVTGTQPGQRFPDLRLIDPKGRDLTLANLRGRAVVLHFWGSWCPHCVVELPDLQALAGRLRDDGRVAMVLIPVREDFAQARDWARRQGLRLPLYDGGETVPARHALRLADGTLLPDRKLARVFPTTYVLDRQGLVVFSHQGPVAGWPTYSPLLKDVAEHSGKAGDL